MKPVILSALPPGVLVRRLSDGKFTEGDSGGEVKKESPSFNHVVSAHSPPRSKDKVSSCEEVWPIESLTTKGGNSVAFYGET